MGKFYAYTRCLFIFCASAFSLVNSYCQYSLSATTYHQDFNGLGTSSSAGVTGGNLATIHPSLSGWFFSENGSNANTTITAGNGSAAAGDTYNFGLAANADRTLGGLQTGTLNPAFGFYFTNSTGYTLTAISISYTGKTWRVATANRSDQIDFQFSTSATTLTNGTWSDLNTLDYTNPGQSVGNGSVQHSSLVSGNITGLSIAQGSTLFIRWTDYDASGADDGMGIDDLTITVTTGAPAVSSTTDYFRSKQTGDWNVNASWQSSPDNSSWIDATLVPTSAAASISIESPNIITISNAQSAKMLTIQTGASLIHNAVAFSIVDDGSSAVDFVVNGTYVIKGTQPIFAPGAAAEINAGGEVRADDNTGGESDNFARSMQVLFKTGSLFRWNNNLAFETNGLTYFPSSTATDRPVFLISTSPASIAGSAGATIFNGKFEVAAGISFTFGSAGTKTFRDGLGGNGILIHNNTCGSFIITADNAEIDDALTVNLQNNSSPGTNELVIASNSTATVCGTATIHVGTASYPNADFLISGILKHNSSGSVNLSFGSVTISGSIDAASSGTFTTSASYTNITIGGSGGGSAGIFACTGLSSIVNSFTINRTGSNAYITLGSNLTTHSLTLTNGIIATGNYLFTYDQTGTLTAPNIPWVINSTSYANSYVCTCDATGTPLSTTDGTQGFRINNVGGGIDTYFPVGPDFNSPNRMLIKNEGITENFTVVVGVGDIGQTALPVVKRIWYVTEATPGGSDVSMKLFFTKRDPLLYPSVSNNEVESGFDFTDMHLVQKPDGYADVAANADVLHASPGAYNFGTEIFGQLTKGITYPSYGIQSFSKFTVLNTNAIILNSVVSKFTALQQGNIIGLRWDALNISEINGFVVQKSATGNGIFKTIGTVEASANSINTSYYFTDTHPHSGKNYYRLQWVSCNSNQQFSGIVSVDYKSTFKACKIYPNPARNKQMTIQFNRFAGKVAVDIYTLDGKLFLHTIIASGYNFTHTIQLPVGTPGGMYVVRINANNFEAEQEILIE